MKPYSALKLKLKPITIRSYMFSHILHKLFCFYVCTCQQVSEFHWLFKLSSFLLIGHLDYFGFGFTTFSPVQLLHTIIIILNSSSNEYQLMASSCSVEKNGQAGMSRQYMYVKCTLACWAEYKCVQNAPWLVRQNRHECKMDPELLDEYTFMQNAPWLNKQQLNVCKMHPGLLGRIYTCM